jgi:murein DD-endopeptidase MepM/ murein hydrolase activator NlpD
MNRNATKPNTASRVFSVLVLFGLLFSLLAMQGTYPASAQVDEEFATTEFIEYVDQKYGFSITVPYQWHVIPAQLNEIGTITTITSFDPTLLNSSSKSSHDVSGVKIDVGLITYNIPNNVPLELWVEPDQDILEDFVSQSNTTVNGMNAIMQVYVSGYIVFINSGQNVYFLSVIPFGETNIASAETKIAEVILQSFMPPLDGLVFEQSIKPMLYQSSSDKDESDVVAMAPSGYRLPFAGQKYITAGPGCYYTHSGRSSEAIDFGLSIGNRVLATQSGNIIYATYGWNDGFGNLLKLSHGDNNTSWYAHLESFVKTSGSFSVGEYVASSGNTGNVTGPHLHFEVRNSSNQSIWIRDLPGITWYSGNVNSPCQPSGNDGVANGPPENSGGTPPTACSGPTNLNPGEGHVSTNATITFSWSAVSGCTFNGYTIRIKDTNNMDSGGNTIVDSGEGGTSRTVTIASQWHNRDLWWGVRAANAPNGASWAVRKFRVQPGGGCALTSIPSGYNHCANEGGNCNFSGTANVIYGANSCYTAVRSFSGGTACNNDVFGDPIPGVQKACYTNGSTGGGSVNWNARYFRGHDHWWDTNNFNNQMCDKNFSSTMLDRNYGSTAPCGNDVYDNWVVEYKATVNFPAGNYVFQAENDDGLKVWLNNQNIIERGGSDGMKVACPARYLSGNVDIKAILREEGGDARVKLQWSTNTSVCTPPGEFSKSNPSNTATGVSTSPTLSWGTSSNASRYSYCIDTINNNSCDTGWQNVNTATSKALSGLTQGTTYYWQVRANNDGGEKFANNGSWWAFTTQPNLPSTPSNLRQTNSTTNSVTISWNDVSNETGYKIYEWNGATFVYLASVGANVTSFTETRSSCGWDEFYTVSAYNANGESAQSGWIQAFTQGCPTVNVKIGSTNEGTYTIAPGNSRRINYPGRNTGPTLTSSNVNSLSSMRVLYNGNSYSEMMGFPASKVTNAYIFPYYNNVAMNSQLRVSNLGNQSTTIRVYLGNQQIDSYTLAAGNATRKNYTGRNSGPLRVESSATNILSTIRVVYADSSYSELMGYPVNQLTNNYLFPYYNNVAMNSQLRVSNLGSQSTTIRVYLGNQQIDTYTLAAGAATRKNYSGRNSGPLRVTSSATNIITTIRVVYGSNSYSELMGFPANQLAQEYHYPVYDNVNLNSQLRVSNVGTGSTTIRVYLGNQEIASYTLAAGEATRKNYSGRNGGPLRVTSSSQPIMTTVRTLYAGNSYYEMTGLPSSWLSTQYWFPWYNNIAMSSELRIAVP